VRQTLGQCDNFKSSYCRFYTSKAVVPKYQVIIINVKKTANSLYFKGVRYTVCYVLLRPISVEFIQHRPIVLRLCK